MNENTYIERNTVEPVPPVPPSTAWPPPWIGGELVADASSDPEPVESLPGPCPTCLCAIGWQLPAGRVLCAECHEQPVDAAKVVFVDDGRGWTDYATERERHERRHDTADEPDGWDDGEPWTAATPTCPTCGSCAGWVSMADRWHCLTCEPPRRAQRIARQAAVIRRRFSKEPA